MLAGIINSSLSLGQILLRRSADISGSINVFVLCTAIIGLSCLFALLLRLLIIFTVIYGTVSGSYIAHILS